MIPAPLLRYCPQCSACLPKTTMSTKQTSSFNSSPCLYRRLTARPMLATGVPFGVYRSSGFRVRFPRRITLLNPATGKLLRRCVDRPRRHKFFFEVDGQKLDDRVFQPIGPLQFTDCYVGRPEVEVDIRAFALPLHLVRKFLLPPVFRFDELRAGLLCHRLHFLDQGSSLLVGDRRTNNEQRLVELHAAILLDKGPGTWSLSDSPLLLRRMIQGHLLRSRPEKILNVLQRIRFRCF